MCKWRRPTKRNQKGGLLPLLALAIPGMIAAGKAAALGAVGTGAGMAVKAIADSTKKKKKPKRA